MNKTSAKEWLRKAYHDLSSAEILYKANHFTDCIGVDLHYAIEKILKTFLAYDNQKIPKTHNLLELNEWVPQINIEEVFILHVANRYHIEESYPHYERPLPSREEIKEVLDFTSALFEKACKILEIETKDVMK